MKKFLIASSILSANFAKLGEDVSKAISAGADIIHFDVMDNHYVPNLTIGPMVLKSLRQYGISVPIDVHLMTQPVDCLIKSFAVAGASCIIFHPEASNHIDRSLQLIKKYGCQAGLAFNPSTPMDYLEYVLDKIDIILLMSVNPGLEGQLFLSSTFNKLRQAHKIIQLSCRDIRLAVDGGIKIENIGSIVALGANMFISGSAIFKQSDYFSVINSMRYEIKMASKSL